jgi:hypothetical protein
MPVSYKWSIQKLQVLPQTEDGKVNAVTHVHWQCTATDGDVSATSTGIKSLGLGDSFVDFNQLTEQQVLDWCFASKSIVVDGKTFALNFKDAGEAQAVSQINAKIDKAQTEPALPWV